jgi:hypothetical protein
MGPKVQFPPIIPRQQVVKHMCWLHVEQAAVHAIALTAYSM